MTDPTIRLDQLDALAGLLPETTPPRMVAEIARWGIEMSGPAISAVAKALSAPAAWAEVQLVTAQDDMQAAPAPVIPPTSSSEWTDEEKRTLGRMWDEGAAIDDIAAALPGRTPRGIQEMRRRIGLAAREPRKADRGLPSGVAWTESEDAVLTRMWGEGATGAEISAALPGRTLKAVQLRKQRLSPREAAPEVAPAAPEVAPAAPEVAPAAPEVAPAGLSEGPARIVAAMADLDESFEPNDDMLLVEERFKGAAMGGIAEELGCDEAAVVKRWKDIRACKVDNKGGLMTTKGWADLRAAAAYRAALAKV